MTIRELDTVTLRHGLPRHHHLERGARGAVVHIHSQHYFEVEFSGKMEALQP
ncbi:MAG: DUF4926 domain-containing protein [Pseudohongiellaceae bacterium]